MIHTGHLELFKYLRSIGDVVVVGVSSDKRTKERKGSDRPIQSQEVRLEVVDALKYVDYALIIPDAPPSGDKRFRMEIPNALCPDVFVTTDPTWSDKTNEFNRLGIKLDIVRRFKDDISTTDIVNKVLGKLC